MNSGEPAAIAIREARPDDLGAIAAVYLESAGHHAALDPERYAVPGRSAVIEHYRKRLDIPEGALTLVAESDGAIVGFVDAEIVRSPDPMHRECLYCHIWEIAVSAARRGQGIGSRLMAAVEDWGRAQGAEYASLEYNAANTRAENFYRHRMAYRVASLTMIKALKAGSAAP